MNSSSNIRFGDYRYRQSKVQQPRRSERGSGRRRVDPSVHATSRPYHTSAPGIRMNVTTNAQIAGQMTHPVQQRYLDRMKISEKAQQKIGRDADEEGRQYDKNGLAMLRGLRHSQGRGAMPGPNQDRINAMVASLTGQEQALGPQPVLSGPQQRDIANLARAEQQGAGPAAVQGINLGQMAVQFARTRAIRSGAIQQQKNISLYNRQIAAIQGEKRKLKGGHFAAHNYSYDHHKYRR
jgi:hypothetical protein